MRRSPHKMANATPESIESYVLKLIIGFILPKHAKACSPRVWVRRIFYPPLAGSCLFGNLKVAIPNFRSANFSLRLLRVRPLANISYHL